MRALLVAFAVGVLVSPADAQLGGLKKRAEKAVANKVAPPTSTTVRPTPTFDNVVVELTEDRVTRMLAGFAAEGRVAAKNREYAAGQKQREADYERQRAEYERAYKEWEKTHETWDRCMQKYRDEQDAKAQDAQAYGESVDTAALRAVGQRIQAAHQRGDTREAVRLTDSLSSAIAGATRKYTTDDGLEKRAKADCGARPEEPTRPSAPADQTSGTIADGVKAAGIPDDQYRIARERILAWLALGDEKITRGETKYAFSDAELAALGARRNEFRQYEAVLTSY
jgi:hypothetical protein